MDYRSSSVDIDAGHEVVRRIKSLARGTFTPGVLSEIGSFGGLFALEPARPDAPVLVAGTAGVGTKLKVPFRMNRHDTIGEDLVNHCVNDILVQGAPPLFFLDYFATGRHSPDVAVAVVEGLARACRANGCALLGGETAEMPGFYTDGEYDLAGFIVGIDDRERVIDGRGILAGGEGPPLRRVLRRARVPRVRGRCLPRARPRPDGCRGGKSTAGRTLHS